MIAMRQLSVKHRIVVIFILFIIIPSMAFLYISISSYSQYALDSIITEKQSIMEQINKNISYQFDNYEDMTMTLYHNAQTRVYIDSEDYSSDSVYIQQFLSSIVNSEKHVVSAILNLEGRKFISGYNYLNQVEFFDKFRQQVTDKKGKVVWIPTQNLSTSYHNNVKNFAMARAVNSPNRSVGELWLFFDVNFFDDVLDNRSLRASSDVMIIASDKHVITSTDKMQTGFISGLDYLEDIEYGQSGHFTYMDPDKKEEYIAIYSYSPVTDWTIVTATPQKVAFRAVDNIKVMTLIIVVLYTIFIILAYILLSQGIFRPIAQLSSGMRKVSAGNFNERLEKKNDDEIGMLVSNYNYMLGKIAALMEDIRNEEKAKNDAKMKVLSMQIGPHFIYNTLNTIKWMASINKQTNIKKMIESLIKLMVNVTYNTNEEICLEEEIELIKCYCYIQKARYMNFDIMLDIPETAATCRVLKFILQPIVENCILYAFSEKSDGGIIEITAKVDDMLYIFIKDNGKGFDTSILEPMKNIREDKLDKIGIHNVIERIRLNYGIAYGMDIASTIGKGTVVTLKLPFIRNGKKGDDNA